MTRFCAVSLATMVLMLGNAPGQEQKGSTAAEPEAKASAHPDFDACSLLSEAEIKKIQGEKPRETKKLFESERGLTVSACLFVLPTAEKSINLRVIRRADGADGRDVRQVWHETFSAETLERLESQKIKRQPTSVPGVGEEAFWMGDLKTGALYVLKKDVYIRVSVAEKLSRAEAIQTCSKIARAALRKL